MDTASETLSGATRIASAQLRVADLEKAIPVWTSIVGLSLMSAATGQAQLGTGGRTLVTLEESAKHPAVEKSVGLFHVALHVPSRLELAHAAARLRASGCRHSAQDHMMSESLYLNDADGNGIEICFDTPHRAKLDTAGGKFRFISPDGRSYSGLEPLDIDGLLLDRDGHADGGESMPPETFLGHMHMRSNSPETAMTFYTEVLGFIPHVASAAMSFFDCGTVKRRHMVAFNTWGGRDLPKAPKDAAGLDGFTIELASEDFAAVESRLKTAGIALDRSNGTLHCRDPDGTQLTMMAQ